MRSEGLTIPVVVLAAACAGGASSASGREPAAGGSAAVPEERGEDGPAAAAAGTPERGDRPAASQPPSEPERPAGAPALEPKATAEPDRGNSDVITIRRYIRREYPDVRRCYEKRLLAAPGLRGTVVVHFKIGAAGGVISAKASGIGDRELETCVRAVVESIQFPELGGAPPVNVRYPFTLRPTGATRGRGPRGVRVSSGGRGVARPSASGLL